MAPKALAGEAPLEHVRREVQLGASFAAPAFERAFAQFVELYNVRPLRVLCSPDVLARFCAVYQRSPDVAHLHSNQARFEGVPLVAAIMAPGSIAFEGEVDEERMGDW